MAVQYTKTLTVSNASTTAVAALQAPTSGTALTLASGAIPNTGQRPSLTSAADLSGIDFTFVGLDAYGNAMTVVMAGPASNTVVMDRSMKSITSITPNGTSASQVSAGYAAEADLPLCPCDSRYDPTSISFAVHIVSGSPTFTARFTLENPNSVGYSGNSNWSPGTAVWFDNAAVSSKDADITGSYTTPVGATSLYVSGASVVQYTQLQAVSAQ